MEVVWGIGTSNSSWCCRCGHTSRRVQGLTGTLTHDIRSVVAGVYAYSRAEEPGEHVRRVLTQPRACGDVQTQGKRARTL